MMNTKFIFNSILAAAVITMASCSKPELSDVSPSPGTANFSRYISVGNSLTAGYADGGLYLEGQQNSYPEMIAGQMKTVGGGSFTSPFFNANQADGSGYLKLTGFTSTGLPITASQSTNSAVRAQTVVPGVGTVNFLAKYTGDLNNYGVPGIKLALITFGQYGNLNPFFERLLPGSYPTNTTSTYLDFVTAKPFTFFSMWLGNNDVLGYATTGGASVAETPTPKATFEFLYDQASTRLTKDGAKGVVATIPDVLSTPFFKTVTLSSLLAAVHVTAPTFNTIYIQTAAGVRAATADDYFLLTLSSANLIGTSAVPYGLFQSNPVESKWVLDKTEAATVTDFTLAYNATIKSVAAAKGLAVMDAYALLREYGAGKVVNGASVSAAFITGNLFSLDGIHLTPMGYSIIANEFIKSINSKYNSSIPIVDVTKYRGVRFP